MCWRGAVVTSELIDQIQEELDREDLRRVQGERLSDIDELRGKIVEMPGRVIEPNDN